MKLFKFDQIFEAGTQSVVDSAKNVPSGGYKSKEEVFGKSESPKSSKMIFTKKLKEILEKVQDEYNNYLAFEMLYMIEPGSKYHNGLGISNIDVGKDWTFLVKIEEKEYFMKIGKFVRYYFPGIFNDDEIRSFSTAYNAVKNGSKLTEVPKRIPVEKFVYSPKNPRSTFLSLVTKTYPHFPDCRHEKEVLQYLPPLKEDKFGNYYKIIGENPKTMFTSHLDTADREQKITTLYSREENGDEIIYTDGSTILGADDKAGVTVMLYMMAHNIPGLYYFFIGEERGGIGSHALADEFDKFDYLKDIKRCISFDRRKTISVITHQLGKQCCSDNFGTALCNELNKGGLNLSLDSTGVYTDSASFVDDISECTNVSVGYNNEHTGRELQNMTYLDKLCKACLNVNWDGLPAERKVGLNTELVKKHKSLIDEVKKSAFGFDVRTVGFDDKIYIRINLDDVDIQSAYDNLILIQDILNRHKVEGNVLIIDTFIKIELK